MAGGDTNCWRRPIKFSSAPILLRRHNELLLWEVMKVMITRILLPWIGTRKAWPQVEAWESSQWPSQWKRDSCLNNTLNLCMESSWSSRLLRDSDACYCLFSPHSLVFQKKICSLIQGETLRGHANHILPPTNADIEAKKVFFFKFNKQDGPTRWQGASFIVIVKIIE